MKSTVIAVSLLFLLMLSSNRSEAFQNDVQCLAMNIYFEAGNQSDAGKLAVAYVTINRTKLNQWPSTICEVVHQAEMYVSWKGVVTPVRNKCQFSWYCDGKPDVPEDSSTWKESVRIAEMALFVSRFDITSGSTHYHTTSILPYWAHHLKKTVTIDDHIFYK